MKIILGQNLLRALFCYNSEKRFISIIGMKIFVGENLLLVSFCYDSKNVL